jgi:hypothetical protein
MGANPGGFPHVCAHAGYGCYFKILRKLLLKTREAIFQSTVVRSRSWHE